MRFLALALAFSTGASADGTDSDRQQALISLLKHDCGSCHGLRLRGGLGPALRPDNIINRTDAELMATILDGRPGTAMPPWRLFLSETDAAWLVDYLRQFSEK